jgi:hypothetical protein
VTKRLRDVSQVRGADDEPVRLRRLTSAERRELIERLGRRRVPLLAGTGGHVLLGRDGQWRVLELWHGDTFTIGYLYKRGGLSEATLVLPVGVSTVFVQHRDAAA